METNKWYVGQKVWDKTVSDEAGEVHNINYNPDLPIVVIFGDINKKITHSYSNEGIINGNIIPTLSTKPYEIKMEGFSQELEEELPYKSQVCWGRNVGDKKWYIGHFVKKEFKNYIINTTVDDENTGGHFTIITTKNPYEVEEDREPQIGDMCFFWDTDTQDYALFGELADISNLGHPFQIKSGGIFKHCSLKNPLIK